MECLQTHEDTKTQVNNSLYSGDQIFDLQKSQLENLFVVQEKMQRRQEMIDRGEDINKEEDDDPLGLNSRRKSSRKNTGYGKLK